MNQIYISWIFSEGRMSQENNVSFIYTVTHLYSHSANRKMRKKVEQWVKNSMGKHSLGST